MKKVIALLLAVAMMATLVACGSKADNAASNSTEKSVKVGFICLHDENSTYDLNFINAAKEACDKLGIEAVFKTNITVLYLSMGFTLVYGRNKERFFLVFARPGYLTSRKDRFVYAVLDKFVIAVVNYHVAVTEQLKLFNTLFLH